MRRVHEARYTTKILVVLVRGWRSGLLHQHQRGRGVTLAAEARAVHDPAVEPDFRGAAAVEVHRFVAAEFGHEISDLGHVHADGKTALAAIDFDKEKFFFVP